VRIGDLYGSGKPVFSFEFFPPKSDAAEEELLATVRELKEVGQPDFVSVTYGAGGSTGIRTFDCVTRIQTELGIPSMAHLTSMGHTRAELHEVVTRLRASGIENILALRGDPPKNGPAKTGDLPHATDLMEFLKSDFDVDFGGACYPEVHPEATSAANDRQFARLKVERGARFLITQLFFDNRDYFELVQKLGVHVPVVPGIMPITNVGQTERFTKMCGAKIPESLSDRLSRHREDAGAVMAIGMEHAILQCRELLAKGAPGLHFYTLNKSLATRVILAALRRL
jgi:methylenetetrahydrofolate reductase (NADPH)